MALQDSWCDREAMSTLCAAITAWQGRRSVLRTEHGAALTAVPATVILVRGPTGVGKRALVDTALRHCCRNQKPARPLNVRRPDLSDVVDDEAVCGPCALLRPMPTGTAEGADADSLASFVDVPGFDKILRSNERADADTVIVLDRLDIVFPASLYGGGGRSSDDNDDNGRPSSLLTFGASGGAGIGATSGLVALAGRLTAREFDSLVIVTTVSSGGVDALHPFLGQAAQVVVDVAFPSLNTRREFFRRSLSQQLLLHVDKAGAQDEAEHTSDEDADDTAEKETSSVAAHFLDWVAEEMAARNGGASYHRLQVLVRDLARDPRFVARVRGAMLGEPVVPSVASGFVAEAVRNRPHATNGDGAGASEQPQSERVRWEDVVGLDDVKQKLRFAAAALRPSPRAAAGAATALERFMRAHTEPYVSGILLYGLPGTGKTMLAKALATEASAAFMTANVSDLVHSFVGESERRVRELFTQARKWAPSVVFLDEVQAAFGSSGDRSAGHEDRLVATLIEEMDACRDHGTDTGARVLVVAATNVPGRIGKGLLGPGRLEEHVHVPPPPAEATVGIIEAVLSRWGWDGAVTDDGRDDNQGWRIATDVAEALAVREGALWSAADVAAAMNLVGLDVAARLAAASADGTVSRDAMRHALNTTTRSAVLDGVGKAAVANVQPSGSQMMLMELRSWRSNLRDVGSLSFAECPSN